MEYRILGRDEIDRLREIDRREIIDKLYVNNDGRLELKDVYYNVTNEWWVKEEVEKILIPRVKDILNRGGSVIGAFHQERIVGMVALESKLIGSKKDQLKLDILFVSSDYRNAGIGKELMNLAMDKARNMGAKKLYVSATPSKNTVEFYLNLGCKLASEIDMELFELEPEDIHLELEL